MFKKIKEKRKIKELKKKKIELDDQLEKLIILEITETLCTICAYLNVEGAYRHNKYAEFLPGHFLELNELSKMLRESIRPTGRYNKRSPKCSTEKSAEEE